MAIACLPLACSGEPERPRPNKVVVIGIDGADWRVIEPLWAEGRLPHLRALADRGVRSRLITGYNTVSAVVWSTIGTGMIPATHGITNFVVATRDGDVPVSSRVRRVPAIWNMASAAGVKTAVLGWWASWPAESINGVVISDRALLNVPDAFSPPAFASHFQELLSRAGERFPNFPSQGHPRDPLIASAAEDLAREGNMDLILCYFKGVDVVGHGYWKYYQPANFGVLDPAELEAYSDLLPKTYEAMDEVIGRIVASAGPNTNVFVMSDHGFYGMKSEQVRVRFLLDVLLEQLGFQVRDGEAVVMEKSEAYGVGALSHHKALKIRFALSDREPAGMVSPEQAKDLERRLRRALESVRYRGTGASIGEPVVDVRAPTEEERERGADLVVEVLTEGAAPVLLAGDREFEGVVTVSRISGSHGNGTHGIFLAAGPDINVDADLEGINIHDVTPTLLFALALPTGEDMDGHVYDWLFTDEFRAAHPARSIASWGAQREGDALSSEVDEDIIQDLKALGYL